MAYDLKSLVAQMQRDGSFQEIGNNRFAQFGNNRNRVYLGATLLPEQLTEVNDFTESQILYKTVAAPDGSMFSPAQMRQGNVLGGQFKVSLGNQDIASEFTARDFSALVRTIGSGRTMEATTRILDWVDTVINRGLIEAIELQRFQMLENAVVLRVGDNGYEEEVKYPNPTGHRLVSADQWSNDATDIFEIIFDRVNFLSAKGYDVNRIVTSKRVLSIMSNNATVRNRTGSLSVVNGNLRVNASSASLDAINGQLQSNGLPPLELYDLRTNLSDGSSVRFMSNDVMLFLCTTGRDQTIEQDGEQRILVDTLGYVGVGVSAAQSEPGRVIQTFYEPKKPPRLYSEGFQLTLPVPLDPEAFCVIKNIS